jgi:hypothetical protein
MGRTALDNFYGPLPPLNTLNPHCHGHSCRQLARETHISHRQYFDSCFEWQGIMETTVIGMKDRGDAFTRVASSLKRYSTCLPLPARILARLTVSCLVYRPVEMPAQPEHRRCTGAQVHHTGLRTVALQLEHIYRCNVVSW